jgi:hypothetical protein
VGSEDLTIRVELDATTVRMLAVLAKGNAFGGSGRLKDVLEHLIHSAADGVCRPASWERAWVVRAFGHDWARHLEADPEAPQWRQRPRTP